MFCKLAFRKQFSGFFLKKNSDQIVPSLKRGDKTCNTH